MAARLDLLVPELRDAARALVDAASAAGLQPRVTSTLRSHAEQIRLYRRFLAGHAGFPVAPPGQSAHEYGEAFDLVVSPMDALQDVGYTWETWGGAWNPGDAIHFELPGATQRAITAGNQSLLQKAAEGINNLPWYMSLLLPFALTTERLTDEDQERIRRRSCSLFHIACR